MDPFVYEKMAQVERTHWWFLARREILKRKLSGFVRPNAKILDVGCGTGALTEMLGELGEATGCDSNTQAIELCRRFSRCDAIETDVLLKEQGRRKAFDVLCLFDVLEHTVDDQEFLRMVLPLLKDDGMVALTVPAFRILWGRHDVVSRHYRRYRKAQVTRLLAEAGFVPACETYFNFFLSPVVFLSRLFERVRPKQDSAGDLDGDVNPLLNQVLFRLFKSEARLLERMNLPFGVSFLGVYRRAR